MRRALVSAILSVCACCAQTWEIGGAGGYGLYRDVSVDAPFGKAAAGIRNRFAFGVVVGQDLYEHLSGEIRYLYQDGDPFISTGGVQGNVQGQSHAIHYDLLFQFRGRQARVRPYLIAGGGAKDYVVSGPPPYQQPLPNIAILTTQDEWRPLATPGFGVTIRAGRHVLLRLDFLDYLTAFPKRLIQPAPFGTARGLFQQFTPLVGVSYTL